MANLMFFNAQTRMRDVKEISGVISLSAAAAVTATLGRGFTVAKTGTGLYTITLEDSFVRCLGIFFTKFEAAASVTMPMGVSNAVSAANPTIVFKTAAPATGVAADIAAAMEIHFLAKLHNSSVL
jgi:hypothetical protein